MTTTLRECPGCSRHVRVGEGACPFCGARLGEALRSFAPPRSPTARLSRAALFAVGAAGFVGGAVSCSSSSSYGAPCVGSCLGPEREAGVEEGADGAPDSASIDAGSIVDVEADASPEASCCSSEDQTCCLLDAAYGGSPFDGDEPPLPTDATTDAGPGPGDASQDH